MLLPGPGNNFHDNSATSSMSKMVPAIERSDSRM